MLTHALEKDAQVTLLYNIKVSRSVRIKSLETSILNFEFTKVANPDYL
jgi:hypothetical protein